MKKLRKSFPLTQSKSGLDPKFMKHFAGSNPKLTKLIIVRIQSNPVLISGTQWRTKACKLFWFSLRLTTVCSLNLKQDLPVGVSVVLYIHFFRCLAFGLHTS